MNSSAERRLAWIFRVAVCLEYVGHGAFGVLTKKAWVPYFGVFGIPEDWAWKLMPIVGTVDILFGLWALIRPCRAVLLYMAVWGFATALLRPLSGEPVWETVERAGNFGVPLAFFLFAQSRGWLSRVELRPLDSALRDRLAFVLRATTGTLLIGHGVLAAAMQKAVFFHHLQAAGLAAVPVPALGGFEIALGVAVLLAPIGPLLLFIFAWKVVTEMLYPLSGAPFLKSSNGPEVMPHRSRCSSSTVRAPSRRDTNSASAPQAERPHIDFRFGGKQMLRAPLQGWLRRAQSVCVLKTTVIGRETVWPYLNIDRAQAR